MGRHALRGGLVAACLAIACGSEEGGGPAAPGEPGGAAGASGGAGSGGKAATGGSPAGGTGGGASSGGVSPGGARSGGTAGVATGGASASGGAVNSGPCEAESAPLLADVSQKELVFDGKYSSSIKELSLVRGVLYFTQGSELRRLRLGQLLAELVTRLDSGGRTLGLHFNDTHVFLVVNSEVVRAPLDATGATAEVVAPVPYSSQYIGAVSTESVYVIDGSASTISAVPVAGGASRVVATGVSGSFAVFVGGHLYFARVGAGTDEIARIPEGGGEPEAVAAVPDPDALAVDGSDVFVANRSGLFQTSLGSSTQPRQLMRSPPTFTRDFDALSAAGPRIHWSSNSSVFGWAAKDGSSCAAVVDVSAPFNASVATSSELYVSSSDGIYRIPLP